MSDKDDDLTKSKELFSEFLSENHILIADPSSASRRRLAKTLVDLGAKMTMIGMHDKFEEAEAFSKKYHPKLAISDFFLGNGASGFDLLKNVRETSPEQNKNSLFMLVTANSSQSVVAQAAEEDVDTFVLKPYTMDSLIKTVVTGAVQKLHPNEYRKTVELGKDLLYGGNIDEAMALFIKATKMDPKPALAWFYHGQAEYLKNALEGAKGSYGKGLTFNKIHYKCLVGLFDLLMKDKQAAGAYEVVQKIAKYFPANPQRLGTVLRLAITTNHFEDIETYYQVFTGLESRPDELVRYICSALIVTAKYYFRTNSKSRAIELLEKTAISCAGQTQYIRLVCETLLEFDLVKDAQEKLKRFSGEALVQKDFLISSFLVETRISPSKALEKGRALLQGNIHSPVAYKAFIELLRAAENFEEAEFITLQALQRWPNKKEEFEFYLPKEDSAA